MLSLLIYFLFFLLRVELALATTSKFQPCNKIRNLIPKACWLFDEKEGVFLPIKKLGDPGNEVAKYKRIDGTRVYIIAQWRVILLQILY